MKPAPLALTRLGWVSPFPQHPERALPAGPEVMRGGWVGCSAGQAGRRLESLAWQCSGRWRSFAVTGPSGGQTWAVEGPNPPCSCDEPLPLAEAAGLSAANPWALLGCDFLKAPRRWIPSSAAEFQLPLERSAEGACGQPR